MKKSNFEKTIGAFEDRMALRRKMLKATGVRVKAGRLPKETEDQIRDTIINCHECTSAETCQAWLATAEEGVQPPEFCPNHEKIIRLKEMGYRKKSVK